MKSKSALLVVALGLAACSGSRSSSSPTTTIAAAAAPATTAPATTPAPPTTSSSPAAATTTTSAGTTTTASTIPASTTTTLPPLATDAGVAAEISKQTTASPGCDLIDGARCLLPYPNDFYTQADATTPTGLRIDFPAAGMPRSVAPGGTTIDPVEWNRNDGFSPNSSILTFVPNLDAAKSKLPSWTDLQSSLAVDASVVLIDTNDTRRIPLWAELDAKATTGNDRLLVIHPAIGLPEGHHFVVGLRKLVDANGSPIAPSALFHAFRDRIDTGSSIEARRPAMEKTFAALHAAGIERADLFLAWDFTVASTKNETARMLAIRDAGLANKAPVTGAFKVTSTKDNPDNDGLVAREVSGTFAVPNFLAGDGGPGTAFNYAPNDTNPDRLPVQNGFLQASFVCIVPAVAVAAGAAPTHISLYGHGLLGSNNEVDAGNVRKMANEHNVTFCATKWIGLSDDDVGAAAAALGNITLFPAVTDRLQQGVLDTIVLGELMKTTMFTDPAFALAKYDTAHLVYDGNSQGGIMGSMLAAVSPDIERAVLGVPGINYSLLLPRSVDFTEYEAVMTPSYPSELDRTLIISLMQMLWDRGEGGGYVQHLTSNPLPGATAKPVLLDVAYGDHQVSELSAMVEARTIGAKIHTPIEGPGRSQEVTPGWGIDPIPSYPYKGSAIIIWDSGASPIPVTNTPPGGDQDPHEDPRADVNVRRQKAAFLFDGQLIDVCNAVPCTAAKS